MESTDLKIGLAFSGGGYRAACFSLGVLSYLNDILIDNETLLSKVIALSTVSGGTITGARYAVGIKRGETFKIIYDSLCDLLTKVDLIDLGLDNLIEDRHWESKRIRSLINAFSDVYDEKLFNKAKFGILLNDNQSIHLKHISFNATEFTNGLQFRFQVSEKINNPEIGEPEKGIIGNYYYRIPECFAKEIRMSDILAASTCFPGGFEPINFPTDFILPPEESLKAISNWSNLPVGLMDGGVVDNQGIEPLLLAEKRMKRNTKLDESDKKESNILDLLIISDVARPYMEEFKASEQKQMNFFRSLNPQVIYYSFLLGLILSLTGIVCSISYPNLLIAILSSVLATGSAIGFILCHLIRHKIRMNKLINPFIGTFTKIFKLKLLVYESMASNRIKSLLKMTNEVFLKHVRRLNYEKIWDDNSWKNRRIMNAIYELRPGEEKLQSKIKSGTISVNLIPSTNLQDIAYKASKMGTTLWFTKEELKDKMPDTLIACGQFNMCWNLLEYINKIKTSNENTNENHKILLGLESKLMEHWEKFKTDPLWMVNDINSLKNGKTS